MAKVEQKMCSAKIDAPEDLRAAVVCAQVTPGPVFTPADLHRLPAAGQPGALAPTVSSDIAEIPFYAFPFATLPRAHTLLVGSRLGDVHYPEGAVKCVTRDGRTGETIVWAPTTGTAGFSFERSRVEPKCPKAGARTKAMGGAAGARHRRLPCRGWGFPVVPRETARDHDA
jgi:hypothetical protein